MPTYPVRKIPAKCPTYTKQLHSLSGIEVDYFNLKTKRLCWPSGIHALGRQMLFTVLTKCSKTNNDLWKAAASPPPSCTFISQRPCCANMLQQLVIETLHPGPDGTRDHRVTVCKDPTAIGIGDLSPEATVSTDYLFRPDWKNPPSLFRKHERVGGVGWGIPRYSDSAPALSDYQMRRCHKDEFRKGQIRGRTEEKYTHRYMCPWYPAPDIMKRPQTCPARFVRNKTSSLDSDSSYSDYSSPHMAPQPPSAPRRRPNTYEQQRNSRQEYFFY